LCARGKAAEALQPGEHASTFGGGPLVCAAALAAFDIVEKEGLAEKAHAKGQYIKDKVTAWTGLSSLVKEVRGMGLLIGIELLPEGLGPKVVEECRLKGLLINCIHGMVLRMVPPLVITESEIDQALAIVYEVLKDAV
jgi:acetylornithine/succinyldiaminopimelate/putrescine aminotransferase